MPTTIFNEGGDVSLDVHPFHYRVVSGSEGSAPESMAGTKPPVGGDRPATSRELNSEAVRRALEVEFRTREKQAREEGFKEGQAEARAEVDREIAATRESLALTLKQFQAEREEYYHSVEGLIVNLALAIARKILHREAQIDPLLLSGAVRVALEKVSSANLIRMFVHPDQVQTWKEFLDRQTEIRQKPEVLGETGIAKGQCRIESSVGTAELSIENQITEIERGFFDLLAQRPQNP